MSINEPRYVFTDDRQIQHPTEPCTHRKCVGGPCRAYSEETLKITEADQAMAEKLVTEGWMRTSNRYRTVVRFLAPPPALSRVCDPGFMETVRGQELAQYYEQIVKSKYYGTRDDIPHEQAVLSPSLFRAFVKTGGRTA